MPWVVEGSWTCLLIPVGQGNLLPPGQEPVLRILALEGLKPSGEGKTDKFGEGTAKQ